MFKSTPLLDVWIRENNDLVAKWKNDANARRKDRGHIRQLSLEFHKLLAKIQGAPHLAEFIELELTVMYNASVFSIALSEFSRVEQLITNVIYKVLQIPTCTPRNSGDLLFWRKISEMARTHPKVKVCIGQLFCLQWAIWLATQKCHAIKELEKDLSLLDLVSTVNESKEDLCKSLLLILKPKEVVELLHVCTLVEQGAQQLSQSQYLDALNHLKKASALPAPRSLVACTHLLSGSCFVQMKRHQMALVCFRKALETDCHCVGALYQSMLIYRQIGNKEAELQALELLCSNENVTQPPELHFGGGQLISSSLLLSSPTLKNCLTVPSALTVLHSLASRCVLHGRVTEGVEHYLDLLASLHTDKQNIYSIVEVPTLPHLPDLYLEAAAAMLMVPRPADCIALCEEVISKTQDLLPERFVLEESDLEPEPVPRDPCVNPSKAAVVLWVGAAHLLQGHCHIHLKDWKQAISHYTRSLEVVVKVQVKNKECQALIPTIDTLQRLRAFSFAGRGICFAQTEQLKEALRDLQLSLHIFPESGFAGRWCGEVLWRLKRRHESARCYEDSGNVSAQSSKKSVSMYLLEPPTDHLMDPLDLEQKIKDLDFEEDTN